MEDLTEQQEDNVLQYKKPLWWCGFWFFSISSPKLSEELGHLEQKKRLQQELMKSKEETSSHLHMELSQNVHILQ